MQVRGCNRDIHLQLTVARQVAVLAGPAANGRELRVYQRTIAASVCTCSQRLCPGSARVHLPRTIACSANEMAERGVQAHGTHLLDWRSKATPGWPSNVRNHVSYHEYDCSGDTGKYKVMVREGGSGA